MLDKLPYTHTRTCTRTHNNQGYDVIEEENVLVIRFIEHNCRINAMLLGFIYVIPGEVRQAHSCAMQTDTGGR